jgi:hypothetical protein
MTQHDDTRFVVEIDDYPPAMRDAADLAYDVERFAEDTHYGWGNYGHLRVWRWLGGGDLEALTVGCRQPVLEFDDQHYAFPLWVVTGPDGHEHVTVCVRIDGRA